MAVQKSNGEVGGRSLEMAEKEFILRVRGYIQGIEDLKKVAVGVGTGGVPILLGEIANVQLGPDMRRGIAELNGVGETVGGIVVVRYGANARQVITDVKQRLDQAMAGLPPDVKYSVAYDRTALIDRAVKTLAEKLVEESIVVALVCIAFLLHLRSSLVAILILPIAVLISFVIMYGQGLSSNIMSLGGIAIAIGAMVDAVIIMIENAHKHLERDQGKKPHWNIIRDAAIEVGPTLFYSLLVITVSFIPVFTLQAQEGRLFKPLAFTKTYSMGAAALLSITLAPVLMGYFIRGKIPAEEKNPVNRFLIWLYHPLIDFVIHWRWAVLFGAAAIVAWVFFPWTWAVTDRLPDGKLKAVAESVGNIFPFQNLGSEFMPPLYEGDLLYMPTTFPGISPTKAREIIQVTDKIIASFPEVHHVFGKIGRAETATDPAPLEMFETTIQFKPRDQWRAGMTQDKLVDELDRIVRVPGLANIWVPPIRNRIDMLATGIKSPVGVKVAGTDLATIDRLTGEIERVLKDVPGVTSALAERLTGGRYVDVNIRRDDAARFGMNIADVQSVISSAVGGENIGETVEGLQRFPINLRYPREIRDSLDKLRNLPIVSERGARLVLADVADIRITDGPPMLRSENARLSGWVYVDIRGRDLSGAVQDMQRAVMKQVKLPPGYSISWSGQFEFLERATAKLKIVVPFTLLIIFVLLYLTFKRFGEALLIMAAVPFALVGGIWLLYLLGYNLSVAGAVGFIALAGVSAEFGVIMLLYLKHAWQDRLDHGKTSTADLLDAIREGAVLRVRPKAMTVAVILAGLFPIMWGTGTGSEVMQRIAAPMVGGMITAPLLSMFVIPAAYLLMRRQRERPTASRAFWRRRSATA